MKSLIIFLVFSLFLLTSIFCQDTGRILFISSINCEVIIDGEQKITITSNHPNTIKISTGEHLIQNSIDNSVADIIVVESGKQKIYKIDDSIEKLENVSSSNFRESITVIDADLSIPGGFSLGMHALDQGIYETSGVPIFPYYFEKGDELIFNIKKMNNKGTNSLEVYSYPDGNKILSKNKFEDLKDFDLKINKSGIYIIEIATNYSFNRTLNFKLLRKTTAENPVSSKVEIREKFDLVHIQEPMSFWVHSTSNETWKGGSSEVSIPVTIPDNTTDWFYVFTASREKGETESVIKNANLLGGLAAALTGGSTAIIESGVNIITTPPGSNNCNVYLLDQYNSQLFESDNPFKYYLEGSRENIKSGKVRIKKTYPEQLFLGFRNTDSFHGIEIGIEIVALVSKKYFSQVDM